jgi:ribosome-binding factor A
MRRIEQVKELLKRELGTILKRELDVDSGTMVTITEITLTPDFTQALVYVSIFPSSKRKTVFRELSERTAEFRELLAKRLPNLHPLAHFKFRLDKRPEEAGRIEELIRILKNEDNGPVVK